MPSYEMRATHKAPFDATVQCSTCEYLVRKVNEARMHALLARVWAEMREKQAKPNAPPASAVSEDIAASRLEDAFRILEGHWREAHRMNC